VTCPWHGWQYDVTTGVSPVNPAAKVKKYGCKVEGSDIIVEVD
jgi:nitrite reductase/ring-hydroxylating ferredoxin subunit